MNHHRRLLGVNIDHVASLRQARGTRYPEPVQAALLAEEAGADAITVHLREDRRHIQDRDIELLNQTLQTRMNLEMAATEEMLEICTRIRPADCCLVPERREELTTEGGLDLLSNTAYLTDYCAELRAAGVRVSLFIDADPAQIEAAAKMGVPVVEIHTGHYADARGQAQYAEWQRIAQAMTQGKALGLQMNAGHGLDYHNVQAIAALPEVEELNIGHSIVARALFVGLKQAVVQMRQLIQSA